jgi:outer membrane cobalamin receptor
VLIDGIRLNSSQNALVDLSLYELDNVSRIEISKGGSSALYGSEAIGGVINIITKKQNRVKPVSLQLKVNTGSFGLRKFYGSISHQIRFKSNKNITYDFSLSDERAKNNYNYYFKNGSLREPKERGNSDYNLQSLRFDFSYSAENSENMNLFTNYTHFDRGLPGADLGYSPGTARQVDYISLTSFSYNRKFSNRIFFKTNISYKYSLQKYFDTATFNLSVKINSFYKLNNYANSSSVRFISSDNFELESGFDVSYSNIYSNEIDKGDLVQAGIYAAGKFGLESKTISKITFYPSVRMDYFSNLNQNNVVTGKLGMNVKPFGKIDLSFKTTIGNNFSAPTFNELYWKDIGNKDLKPERSISFDAGLIYRFDFALLNEIELSYYSINTIDRIVWTPVSGIIWRPINVGRVNSEGIDISLSSKLSLHRFFNVLFNFNYSFGNAVKKNKDFPGDPSYNKQLLYIPKEMVKSALNLNYLPTSKFIKFVSFNLFYSYNTRRYTNVENTVFTPRYDVFDANLAAGFVFPVLEMNVKFAVNNILNEDYQVISGYPMPLRNYRFEIIFKY